MSEFYVISEVENKKKIKATNALILVHLLAVFCEMFVKART